MADAEERIAIPIDADNAPASKIDVILADAARHGAANVRRAYGNWKSPNLKPWEATLQIGNQASFDSRNYGYRKLSDLIEATELFEVKRQNQAMLIRDKRKP